MPATSMLNAIITHDESEFVLFDLELSTHKILRIQRFISRFIALSEWIDFKVHFAFSYDPAEPNYSQQCHDYTNVTARPSGNQ